MGNKGGPKPSKVYKSQIRFPQENSYKEEKKPALKFENDYESKISYKNQETLPQYDSFDSNIQTEEKETNYEYKSKIRYFNNSPVQNERPIYKRPERDENLQIDQRRPETSNHQEVGLGNTHRRSESNIKKDRLYRHDFPKDSDEMNDRMDNPTKRQAIPNTVPCQGASKYFLDKCVVAKKLEDNENYKRHSSFPNINNEIPASQISSLPYTTQIPRPPISNGRNPYLSYEPTIRNPENSVRSLPQYPTPSPRNVPQNTSVRSLPQYPYQEPLRTSSNKSFPNLILAKRKTRSDVYNTNVP